MDYHTIAPTYFCTGNRFPIELRAIEDSRETFRNPPVPTKKHFFVTRCPRGGDIAHELGNVAHVTAGVQRKIQRTTFSFFLRGK